MLDKRVNRIMNIEQYYKIQRRDSINMSLGSARRKGVENYLKKFGRTSRIRYHDEENYNWGLFHRWDI